MGEETLTAGDVQYLSFYLKDKNPLTGTITYTDLSTANTITFRMRKYGNTTNTISAQATVVTATLGLCRCLVTVPAEVGNYYSEVEVVTSDEVITWTGNTYYIRAQLG